MRKVSDLVGDLAELWQTVNGFPKLGSTRIDQGMSTHILGRAVGEHTNIRVGAQRLLLVLQNDEDLVEAEAQHLRAANGAGAESSPDLQGR